MFANSNGAITKKITKHSLSSDKRRNFFITAAITLTAFMIASVFSIGLSYYESINMREKRMQGSVSHMAFSSPTQEQLDKIHSLDYIKAVGIGAFIAQTQDAPRLNDLDIAYVDKTQWQEMFCPAFTNIKGRYAEQENEIMLSRYILDAMGIKAPEIGMTIPLSYVVNGTDQVVTENFILACIYTEFAHSRPDGFTAIYASAAFAEKWGKATAANSTVNVLFKNEKHVGESIERLKQDLVFSEKQAYTQSPAFNDNYGNAATYTALLAVIVFLMFTGYLLIYNVMHISVSKDVRFYGMLKTLGTTPRQIRRIVTGQVLRLCVIGLPVGCAVSAVVSLLIVPAVLINSGIDTGSVVSFSPLIYIGAAVFSVLTAWSGTAAPANKAANISPIEAMKFTGDPSGRPGTSPSTSGKPYKMAIRNIFRDGRRASVVILSLFLSIVVFTSVLTVVTSIDIDYRINAEYEYDYSFSATQASTYFLSDAFVNSVKGLKGLTQTGITTIEYAELMYSQELDKYVSWLLKEGGQTREDVIKEGAFAWVHGIKGIDPLVFEQINKTLPVPVDAEAFERGEIALINAKTQNSDLAACFSEVTALKLKGGGDKKVFQITVGGVVSLMQEGLSYSAMEVLVSNSFLRQYYPQPGIIRLDANAEEAYDEQIYRLMDEKTNSAGVKMISRYGARIAMQDAKTIMLVLGGGISAILGFIGLFNFINVISVGIMARKHEFATLESIGMSRRQVRSMLRNEGLGYAFITVLCALTLGNGVVYGLFRLFKKVADYARFTYPFIPVLILSSIIVLICFITPELAYRGISRTTLAERLREAE